jgi:hypothetical protein
MNININGNKIRAGSNYRNGNKKGNDITDRFK